MRCVVGVWVAVCGGNSSAVAGSAWMFRHLSECGDWSAIHKVCDSAGTCFFVAEDPRERDYLKTILHRIYGETHREEEGRLEAAGELGAGWRKCRERV